MGFALLDAQGRALPARDEVEHPMQSLAVQLLRGIATMPDFQVELDAISAAERADPITPGQRAVVEALEVARDMQIQARASVVREERRVRLAARASRGGGGDGGDGDAA